MNSIDKVIKTLIFISIVGFFYNEGLNLIIVKRPN
jgi:hypothetical protein